MDYLFLDCPRLSRLQIVCECIDRQCHNSIMPQYKLGCLWLYLTDCDYIQLIDCDYTRLFVIIFNCLWLYSSPCDYIWLWLHTIASYHIIFIWSRLNSIIHVFCRLSARFCEYKCFSKICRSIVQVESF